MKKLGLAAMVLAACSSAFAAPVITYGGVANPASGSATRSGVAGAVHIDFEDASSDPFNLGTYSSGIATYTGAGRILSGSTGGQTAAPPLDNRSRYLVTPVPGGAVPGTITIDFASDASYFGLFWGSVDSYNSIRFLYNGNEVFMTSGSGLPMPTVANGCQTCDTSNLYVNFEFGSARFDQVKLVSTGRAFESDNHAYREVPEPAVIGLLGLGLLGLGAMRRKRNS